MVREVVGLSETVHKAEGAVILEIQLNSGKVVRRHKDHVRPQVGNTTELVRAQSVEMDAAATVPASSDDVETNGSNDVHESSDTPDQSIQQDSSDSVNESEQPA